MSSEPPKSSFPIEIALLVWSDVPLDTSLKHPMSQGHLIVRGKKKSNHKLKHSS